LKLLEKNKVATVPGTAFGQSGKDFIRLSIANSYERLNEATERMADFVKGL
jgi:aminotransferase